MNSRKLYFSNLTIDRLDGIGPPGFSLADLVPGVNVIYGPNASGKTSICGAVRQLLAPAERLARFRRSVLCASLQLDGQPVALDFEMGDVRCQIAGRNGALPPLVPEGVRDRYVFALHDLLGSDDGRDLAQELLRQAAGGFDLAEARNALGFRDVISSRGVAPYKMLTQCRKTVEEVRRAQEALGEDERRLAELEEQLRAALNAQQRADELKRAIVWHEAQREVERRIERLNEFPPDMDLLRGDESEVLEKLHARLAGIHKDQKSNEDAEQDAQAELARVALAENVPPPELPAGLRVKCDRLRSLATTIDQRTGALAGAQELYRQARTVLGPCVSDDVRALLDPAIVDRFLTFVEQGEGLRSEAAAIEELSKWLKALPVSQTTSSAVELERGVALLHRWLAADEAAALLPADKVWRRYTQLAIVGAAVGWGLFSLGMAYQFHASWLAGLLVTAGLALSLLLLKRPEFPDPRGNLEGEFVDLGIPPPPGWSPDVIRAHLRTLQQQAGHAAFDQALASRWSDLGARIEEHREELQQYMDELYCRGNELGLSDDELRRSAGRTVLLMKNIVRCQETFADWQSQRQELAQLQRQFEEQLNEARRSLIAYGYDPASDIERAAAQVEDLAERLASHKAAREKLDACATRRQRLLEQEAEIHGEINGFFASRRIAAGDKGELYRRLRELDGYREAGKALQEARQTLKIREQELGETAPYADADPAALRARLEQSLSRAEKTQELNDEIVGIRARIVDAKLKHDLERALAQEERAADDLRAQRNADCDAIAGHLLAEYLDRQQHTLQQPAVLERSRKLFGAITHGRYRLNISRDEAGDPVFQALETASGRGMSLECLSSGTRLQLLLAVRLAFLESQESQWKLPLILDETLGNCDEARAEQIIDAAIEISSQGRQVFYLTAQYDELSKWRRRLHDRSDVPWKSFDLAQIRNFSERERVPPVDYDPPPTMEIPAPNGDDWLAYGRRLSFPPPNPRGGPEGVHLWYVLDDVGLLHRLLLRGVNLWGQLCELVSLHALPADFADLQPSSRAWQRAQARADLLETVFRAWRVGRGRPVDRAAIEDSQAVGERFLPDVTGLAKELGGDARRLLEALAAGRIARFQQRQREKLQQYLLDNGYLDESEPLAVDEVRRRVRLAMFQALGDGRLDPDAIDVLVDIVYYESDGAPHIARHV